MIELRYKLDSIFFYTVLCTKHLNSKGILHSSLIQQIESRKHKLTVTEIISCPSKPCMNLKLNYSTLFSINSIERIGRK